MLYLLLTSISIGLNVLLQKLLRESVMSFSHDTVTDSGEGGCSVSELVGLGESK